MTSLARFADANDFVVEIADLTDRRSAVDENVSHFAAGHTHDCVFAFFCHKLCRVACRSCDDSAVAGLQLDVVDHRTDGNCGKRKRVAHFDVRVSPLRERRRR